VTLTLGDGPDDCDTVYFYTVTASDNEPNFVVTQTSGLPSGATFPFGNTVNRFVVTDAGGNTNSCSFSIRLRLPQETLNCVNTTTIYLGEDCSTTPEVANLINTNPNTIGCLSSYSVVFDRTLPYGNGPWTPGPLTFSDQGTTVAFRVLQAGEPNFGNNCWGLAQVRDTVPPPIECSNISLPCEVNDLSPAFLASLGWAAAQPSVDDACGGSVTFSQVSSVLPGDYDPATNVIQTTRRVWTATDARGNSGSCVQLIRRLKSSVNDFSIPENVLMACDTANVSPTVTGRPYLLYQGRRFPLAGSCFIAAFSTDSSSFDCGASQRIYRTWRLVDFETFEDAFFSQVIEIQDNTSPTINCPAAQTIFASANGCLVSADLPDALLNDACSPLANLQVRWQQGDSLRTATATLSSLPPNGLAAHSALGVLGTVGNLPIGPTALTYTATDACGNTASCLSTLTLRDTTPPVAVCGPLRTVYLGPGGQADVLVGTLDGGSYDECSADLWLRLRPNGGNPCAGDTTSGLFAETLRVCCAQLDDTVAFTLRAYDTEVPQGPVGAGFAAGHFSDCMGRVLVRDTLDASCASPEEVVVHCNEVDLSFGSYGAFGASCAVDSSYIELDLSLFDTLCKVGTVTRHFFIRNSIGQTAQCLQDIQVIPTVSSYFVRFPNDVTVTTCLNTQTSGQPETLTNGVGCELFDITYLDVLFTVTPDACYRVERIWTVLNRCANDPTLPLVVVQNPVNTTNGPVLSAPDATGSWAPTPLTQHLWAANARGYQYRQNIKVVDQIAPVISQCLPDDQASIPDSSANDPLLWNQSVWTYGDLPYDYREAPLDLSVTATDSCYRPLELRVHYQLFLDLDGDDSPETLVNSQNPVTYGFVVYNNIGANATPREFDHRNVPPNQKWGFVLEQGIQNGQYTARVRWKTQNPLSFSVPPQIPSGNHRIRWFVEDACGNERVCDRMFTLRSSPPPELECAPDLTVNLDETPNGTAYNLADLVEVNSQCDLPTLNYSARRAGTGTGFPTYQNVALPRAICNPDTGTPQVFEIWVQDACGNSTFCLLNLLPDTCLLVPVPQPGRVVGTVKTETGAGIRGVMLNLRQEPLDQQAIASAFTDSLGKYDIPNASFVPSVFQGAYTEIRPFKTSAPLNGVTTFDLSLISKHILNVTLLESPYKILAADANKSGAVTTADIVELRKLILGITNALPHSQSWRFLPEDYVFPNPTNPFQPPCPEIDFTDFYQNGAQFNFIGVKLGDVNGNSNPQQLQTEPSEQRGGPAFHLETEARQLMPGELFDLRLLAEKPADALQFTLNIKDLELIDVRPESNLAEGQYAVFAEKNALSIATETPGRLAFTLRLKSKRAAALHELLWVGSDITPAMAYLPEDAGQAAPVALRFLGKTASDMPILYPARPNPAVAQVEIPFYLPRAQRVALTLSDAAGKILRSQTNDYEAGQHSLLLDLSGFAPGLLHYRLQTADGPLVGKLLKSQ
jgi:hypothetical protein